MPRGQRAIDDPSRVAAVKRMRIHLASMATSPAAAGKAASDQAATGAEATKGNWDGRAVRMKKVKEIVNEK